MAIVKRAKRSRLPAPRWRSALTAILVVGPFLPAAAQGDHADGSAGEVRLVLEVRTNGQTSPLLWEFGQLPDGRLTITVGRLKDLGFAVAATGGGSSDRVVKLDDVAGVTYHYDAARQLVEIDAADAALVPVVLDEDRAPTPLDTHKLETNLGAVLNYGVFGDASGDGAHISGNYDFRFLSRLGVVSTTGVVNYNSEAPTRIAHVRLDTSWRYVDARHVIAYSLGDVIGRGGDLGVVYRLGGVQISREFGDRPDLVTMAVPTLGGSAAVPSTVDLFVNGTRYFNGQVGAGPFEFRSLPNIGGGGTATIVMTDALGRETRIEKPIFFAPELLARGVFDFSAEAGFPRLYYAVRSFDYLHDPAASASARYGLTNWLTVQGHAEGMLDFVNGSAGAILRVGSLGTVNGAIAVSQFRGATSSHYSVDVRGRLAGVNFYGGIERASTQYQNVVTVTALKGAPYDTVSPVTDPRAQPILLAFSQKTDRAGVNFTLFDTGMSFDYTRVKLPGNHVRLAAASVTRSLFGRLSVWANAYRDFDLRHDFGLYVGLNFTFGKGIGLTSSVSRARDATTMTTRLSKTPQFAEDSLGWNVTDSEALSGPNSSYRAASVQYSGSHATINGGVEMQDNRFRATTYVEGAIVAMGGGVFASRRIDSSFAVVHGAGADTPVLVDTRHIATTNKAGRALVPDLPSFQASTLAIDPSELPIDVEPARTQAVVVPGDRAGVIVEFGVARVAEATVILVDAAGKLLPVGAFVTVAGAKEPAVVGYDGRAYLTGLSKHNSIRVEREGAPDCTAQFDFVPVAGGQALIGPVTCQ